MQKIPVAQPDLGDKEKKYVADAINSTWIASRGQYVRDFEKTFTRLCKTNATVATCNGTSALHLAILGMGAREGDEVLVPSLTYVAPVNVVRYVGGKPVFIDVDPKTWCLDPDLLELAITPRTKGIVVVHLYGHPADMDAINRVASRHDLWVIEDAAQAHLAEYKGVPVGGLSDVGAFSFYANKIFTCGEGGAITFKDLGLEEMFRAFRDHGRISGQQWVSTVVGYNFCPTNMACALLCAQLERREDIMAKRRHVFAVYQESLCDIPGINFQPVADWARRAPWMFCITLDEDFSCSRDTLMERLAAQGIETRQFFVPVHEMPPYYEEPGPYLPITSYLSKTGMNLPTYSSLSDVDIERVVSAIRAARY